MRKLFNGCSSLESINFANFKTESVVDMSYLFSGCSSLNAIDVTNFDTKSVKDMNHMFSGCSTLKAIDVSNFNTGSVNDISHMFSGCSSLNGIGVTNFNTKSVNDMSFLFSECSSLNSIDVSKFDTKSVKNISHIFNDCSNLDSINIVNFDTSSMIDISGIFKGCSQLKEINLSKFITSSITNMSNMFSGCISLKSIDLSNFNTEKVTDLNGMFQGCSSLRSLILSNFDTSLVTNMSSMFDGCENLILLDISNFNLEKIEIATNMFPGIKDSIYINLANVQNFENNNFQEELKTTNGLNYKNGLIICQTNDIVINNKAKYLCCDFDSEEGVCKSPNYILLSYKEDTTYTHGFSYNSKNEEIEERKDVFFIRYLDNTYTTKNELNIKANPEIEIHILSNYKSLESFFDINKDENAGKIKSIDFKNLNKSLISNMSSTFNGCKELIYLDLSEFDMAKVEDYNNMFNDVSNLKYIDITNIKNYGTKFIDEIKRSGLIQNEDLIVCQQDSIFIKDNVKLVTCCDFNILNGFCQSTNYISVKYGQTNGGNDIEYEKGFNFYKEENILKENSFRKNLDFINIGNHTYSGKNKLSIKSDIEIEIHFPPSIISLKSFFDSNLDNNAINIISIDFTHLNTSFINDLSNLFKGCSALESLNLSEFDTISVKDMSSMFQGCKALKSLDLSRFNTSFISNMNSMFQGCSELVSLELSRFDTSLVTNMCQMFDSCEKLAFLDISKFDMQKITSSQDIENMFNNLKSLQYINLYEVKDNENSILKGEMGKNNGLNSKDSLIVCQQDQIINNENAKQICCNYNFTQKMCISTNYILIQLFEKVEYNGGFKNRKNNDEILSNDINFIRYDNCMFDGSIVTLPSNTLIEIHFKNCNLDLTSFFDADKDINTKQIKSIDVHLSSAVTKISKMFNGCNQLESIEFETIDTSLVTDMSCLFKACSNLKSIDITRFTTDSVNNFNSMFEGCNKLTSLDLRYLKFMPSSSLNAAVDAAREIERL